MGICRSWQRTEEVKALAGGYIAVLNVLHLLVANVEAPAGHNLSQTSFPAKQN